MTTPLPSVNTQQAQSQLVSGAAPGSHNNTGKIVPKTSSDPAKSSTIRPDVSDFDEYVDSIDEDEIQEEGERLNEELEDAIAAGDKRRAYQIRDAMAGLRQKGLDAGMSAAELASVHGDMGQRLATAFAQWGGRGKRTAGSKLGTKNQTIQNKNNITSAATPKGGTVFEKKTKKQSPDPCNHKNDAKKKKYVVYEADEFDKKGKKIGTYVGRTSGDPTESTKTILERRFKNHHRNVGNPIAAFVTDRYAAVRGAEQILIDKNSTVKQINGVSPTNDNRHDYKACAELKMK